jgi:murein tripeptide amidase MpaA
MRLPDRSRVASLLLVAAGFVLGLAPASRAQAQEEPRPYEGYRIVESRPRDARELMVVSQLGEPLDCIPAPGRVRLLVAPDELGALRDVGVQTQVIVDDAQELVDSAYEQNQRAREQRGASFFDAYRTMDEITAHIDSLTTLPNLPAGSLVRASIGRTWIGDSVDVVRLVTPLPAGAPPRPQILLTSVQHAREWVAGSSTVWIIDTLARGYGTDPAITTLLDNVEFHVVPICNPDGYRFTFPTNQGGSNARLWRKNRRFIGGSTFGVDLNRNWPKGWGGQGASGTPSSDLYRGPSSLSEFETQAVYNYATSLPRLKASIDIHSYSQLVLSPWSWTTAANPRQAEFTPITTAMTTAMSAPFGTSWVGGPTATVLYLASGSSSDSIFDATGALGYAYELRDQGFYGFILPPDQIVPAATETFAGVRVLAQRIQVRLVLGATPPASIDTGAAASVPITISTANGYTLSPGTVALRWRVAGSAGAFESAPATGSGGTFTALLPAQPCGTSVEFFVQATASDGLVVREPASSVFTRATPACPFCPGDANGTGSVDFADITAVLANFGSLSATAATGDANNTGGVDFADVTAVLANFGSTCP